jgi:hypothetical protein
VLIAVSVLLLGQAFYILYVLRRGNWVSAMITWSSLMIVVGFWTWQLLKNGGLYSS